MFEIKIFTRDNLNLVFSIFLGLFIGVIITLFCIHHKLTILGVNISIFIAPVVAGFVETFISTHLRNKSSGAISSIILFFVTNGIGWLFPSQPLTFNIFTVGGFILMLQAAFPLLINYLIIMLFLSFNYVLGLIGGFIVMLLKGTEKSSTNLMDIEDLGHLSISIYNSKPNIPIKEYHGLVCAEDVIEFEEKSRNEMVEYIGSNSNNKSMIKLKDYSNSRRYILLSLEQEALKLNANAIIDMEFEYINYNQQIPPDVVIAAYGTAVTIDEKYLN